jgi:hypothetical protein
MEHLRAAGCRTIYINGSFVTDKLNPNDFDACSATLTQLLEISEILGISIQPKTTIKVVAPLKTA